MDLTLSPKVDPSETTPFVLGGVEFRLATLAARQNRRITPWLADVIAIINRRSAALVGVTIREDGSPDLTPEALVEKQRLLSLTEGEWDMLLDFVAAGLTRCHPAVTREDLLDLPIGADALLAAADAVSAASHMVRRTKAGQAAGEAAAAS